MVKDFTILLVATNNYVDYAHGLISSIHKNLFTESQGQVLIFTDQPDLFINSGSSRVELQTIEIPSYGWPEATLLRYQFFENYWSSVKGQIVMYIDVDTFIASEVQIYDAFPSLTESSIAMVRHPGFMRVSLWEALVARGPNGTWETNPQSTAFVNLFKRRTYVAGGVWLGNKDAIYKMIVNLRQNVEDDLSKDFIAKWHDESHLNYWAANNKVRYLSPAWAYAPGYKNMKSLEPIIELVHKPQHFFDERDE